jgi:hypothetical protein
MEVSGHLHVFLTNKLQPNVEDEDDDEDEYDWVPRSLPALPLDPGVSIVPGGRVELPTKGL